MAFGAAFLLDSGRDIPGLYSPAPISSGEIDRDEDGDEDEGFEAGRSLRLRVVSIVEGGGIS